MNENKKKEELQSRRQFFKKAAKGALPILGALALSQIPLIGNAQPRNDCYSGCVYECDGSCKGGCMGCSGRCTGGCKGSCGTSSYY